MAILLLDHKYQLSSWAYLLNKQNWWVFLFAYMTVLKNHTKTGKETVWGPLL